MFGENAPPCVGQEAIVSQSKLHTLVTVWWLFTSKLCITTITGTDNHLTSSSVHNELLAKSNSTLMVKITKPDIGPTNQYTQ